MKNWQKVLMGALAGLLLAALGYVVYRYRAQLKSAVQSLAAKARKCCRCAEYDDFADV